MREGDRGGGGGDNHWRQQETKHIRSERQTKPDTSLSGKDRF